MFHSKGTYLRHFYLIKIHTHVRHLLYIISKQVKIKLLPKLLLTKFRRQRNRTCAQPVRV